MTGIIELNPDPNNPRMITTEAAKGLRRSIEKYGDLSGIVWNQHTGELVCGHQRVEALKAAGAYFEPRDGFGFGAFVLGEDTFGVRLVDWSREVQEEANIVANSQEIAGQFTDKLDDVLAKIREHMSRDDYGLMRPDKLGAATKTSEPTASG